MNRIKKRSRGPAYEWRHSHGDKKRCSSWAQAFWHLIKVKRHARITNYQNQAYSGHVYECRLTDDYREGPVGELHWHVGRPGDR